MEDAMKEKSYGMRGDMNPQTAQKQKMSNAGADYKGKKGPEKYPKGAHELSPVCRQGEFSVWDKRSK